MTGRSLDDEFAEPCVFDQHSEHYIAQCLIGTVTGIWHLGDTIVLYYADGHAAALAVDPEGDIVVCDHEVNTC